MCLTAGKFKTRQQARDAAKEPLIAKKAFTVYKVLMKNNKSPYQWYQYHPGVNLSAEKFTSTVEDKEWGSNRWHLEINKEWGSNRWHLEINKGLHAMATELDAKKKRAQLNDGNSNHKIVEFIVPAGTPYFLSDDKKEVVSLKLNWKKK